MLNSPTSELDFDDDGPDRDVDGNPAARLAWLLAALLGLMGVVVGRTAWLQTSAAERFIEGFDRSTTTTEIIPTRDGRILSSDGRVLACDEERFVVAAHYRWLEDPPDPDWVRQQALARLGRVERRDREAVAREERRVLERRAAMWERLGALTGRPAEELGALRQSIQRRVEGIVAEVERRRLESERPRDVVSHDDDAGAARRAWRAVQDALTTPPRRPVREPVVIQEELDYHALLDEVSSDVAAEIESRPDVYPGLRVQSVTRRVYPAGSLAAHVIGIRTTIGEEELVARRERFGDSDPLDYRPGDRIGKTGVERAYDHELHGLRGLQRITRDRRGEVIDVETVRAPRPGRDVILTLHVGLQERMESVLDEVLTTPREDVPLPVGGAIVVLDVRNGEVVAAVSGPRHDLTALSDAEEWQRLTNDPRQPFFHRAVQMAVPPGSVFKALTAVAFLESGRIDPLERCPCHGYFGDNPLRNRCYHSIAHGDLNLAEALARSCNVYFFDGADRLGPDALVGWADRFGFGRPTGIDLAGERGGNLPRPARPGAERREPWYPGDTLGLAIGQSRLTATPLQIARMMAAIANGGRLVTPYVVRATGAAGEGNAPLPPRHAHSIDGLSGDTLEQVRAGLEQVVSSPYGTGYKTVRLDRVRIAGKTGTAETGGGRPDHAWFAGYVPADQPRYAFAVVLEHAGSGGQAAGPVARRLVESLLEFELVQPDGDLEPVR